MSVNIDVATVQQYTNNVELLVQQRGSRLEQGCTIGSYVGKAAKAVEQIGSVVAQKRTSRHADTPLISTPHDARWVYPVDYEWADLIDDEDKLRMLIDPTSSYAQNAAYALGRAKDEEIIAAYFGTSKTGQDGNTSTTHPSAQQVAATVGGASANGMNVAKLRNAKKLLMAADVDIDNDPLFVAITAQQHDDLMQQVEAISLDFNTKPVLVEGKITSFMGFNFIHTELLDVNGSSQRRCPAWAKSGMHLGMWNDIKISIDRRPDKGNAMQVLAKGTFGATRTEEQKVVEIICAE